MREAAVNSMSAGGGRRGRRSGLLLPLFSCPSASSWGIGEIGDLAPITAWLAAAGQSVLQLLPLNEMASGQQSPYSAMSALAIDPIFIRVSHVLEFAALGGEDAVLGAGDRQCLAAVRAAPHIEYSDIRRLKQIALRAAFDRFYDVEWGHDTHRARALGHFMAGEARWLDDYALFRALHDREGGRPWTEWPAPLAAREPAALDRARGELARVMLFHQYLQWLADSQWQGARRIARANGVEVFGDLPFMVDADSADVWADQASFRLDVSVGAPPDAFSATGQDWGMPLYNWDAIAAGGFTWLKARARRSAALFDGYRVDHLIGFYRTYGRPRDVAPSGPGFFSPEGEDRQIALGERVLTLMREPGAEIIAEDLGVVPDFVHQSLARLGVPGFRVFRWERLWQEPGQPFRDPATYPPVSVATTGTHDTEPLALWWEHAPSEERAQVAALLARPELVESPFTPAVRDVLLEALFASGSDLLLVPVGDVFGWRDRINVPATVNDQNWSFRLPWPSDQLEDVPEARERRARLREWTTRYRR
jgi:4-alpha-glucanotransferase